MSEREDSAGGAAGDDRAGAAGGQHQARGNASDDRAGDRRHRARDDAAVYRFIERFSSVLGEAGFPRMPARVFVALLSSDSGLLTAAEIAQLLHASPAAVSGGVRYLIQVGLVSSEREPGSRRHRYRMPADVWQELIGSRDRMFTRWNLVLQEGIEALGPGSPAGGRLADTARYFEFLRAEAPRMLAKWREREAAAGNVAGDT
jgi:predicted transcriptional regulator